MDSFIVYSGWVIGVLGAIFTIWSYFNMKAEKEPECYYRTYKNIVKLSKEDKLKILYDGLEVNEVSTTYVFFWNRGRKPIRAEDLPKPIILAILNKKNNVTLLDYRTTKVSREIINFKVTKVNDCSVLIYFDFLDKDDGAVIELKHSGEIPVFVFTEGVILGVPKGIDSKYLMNKRLSRGMPLKAIGYTLLESLLGFYLIFFPILALIQLFTYGYKPEMIYLYIVSFCALPVAFFSFRQSWEKHNFPYPKSLDVHVDIVPYKE